jgi:hypothetical protein
VVHNALTPNSRSFDAISRHTKTQATSEGIVSDFGLDVEQDLLNWYFSGTEQLVEHFFADIAARFTEIESHDPRLAAAATALKRYGRLVRPVGQFSTLLGALGVPLASVVGNLLGKGSDAVKSAADVLDDVAGKQSKRSSSIA